VQFGKRLPKTLKIHQTFKTTNLEKINKKLGGFAKSSKTKSCVNWTIYIFTTNFGKILKPGTFCQTFQTTNLEIFIILLQIQKKLIENLPTF
jgi:hypothetical protein